MRKAYAAIILACIVYFVGGWIATRFGVVTKDDYFAYAGIVGGLASVAGLLALTRPAITQADLKSVEIETLKSMAVTAEQLDKLQSARAQTVQEIDDLALKKKAMELLVKKASLALFLKEQYSHHERQVLEEIAKNDNLRIALLNASESAEKVRALDEEISVDPNVGQLREIIRTASRREPTFEEVLENLPTVPRALFIIFNSLNRSFADVFRIFWKSL
ncbi:hypothetical protein ICY20_14390 [Pseudomonas sp. P115]|uniref:hypothetical protein n=1 Tax=Pseudomonas pisciculturae TaxID=2730413 RepID=UPI0018926917|nr:hypothetical protein [Pseudomonas pisciculturae]MBF6028930.1 hypothetical protein [Pseudomonas pisciculturae]